MNLKAPSFYVNGKRTARQTKAAAAICNFDERKLQVKYQISLPVFQGPFDLLFHLIEKAEVDIYEISIAEITAQYLQALQTMRELNLEIASEFLLMAATLLRLKSKKLLPAAVDEDDDETEEEIISINSREELIEKLVEYRFYRQVAGELRSFEQKQKRVFVRSLSGEKIVLVNPEDEASISGVPLPALLQALERVLAEKEREPQDLSPEAFSVQDKMKEIMAALQKKQSGVDFFALFPPGAALSEIITIFVALLELVRLKKVAVWQSEPLSRQIFVSRL